ncbi:MAG: geranylgeranylglycerol-phosphate geranylgeranyltransferase [Calditrichaceae bacterium]|nr:geranylgeranylglycerol-phosphate geranylgeranyltransferase [Calditrichaceae bacterium]
MKHILYFYKLSRPLNVVITIASVLIAAIITGKFTFTSLLIYATITAAFIAAGANIINDIFDVEIDKINKPSRILAAGKISIRTAWIYFGIAYTTGFVFAALGDFIMLVIAIVIALLLVLYSVYLKRTIIWGNLVVSIAAATAFLYGAQAVSSWMDGIIPAVFALFFHFGREVVKDLQDIEGDLAHNAITFAGRYGKQKSIALINTTFAILIALTLIPYFIGVYNRYYLWIVLLGVDLVLAAICMALWRHNDRSSLGRISHLLKLDMLVGLFSIYVGVRDAGFFN